MCIRDRFNIKDEETRADITSLNSSLIEMDVWLTENYKKHYALQNILNFCYTPNWTRLVYKNNIVGTFRKDGYALAEYFSYSPVIVGFNQTPYSSITIFMLPSQYAIPVKFTLPDQNYILNVERKRDNYYEFLRSTRSDFAKNALVYLRPYDVFYRISIIKPDSSLCFASGDFKIVQNEYAITSCQVTYSNITYIPTTISYLNVRFNCKFNNETLILKCDFEATDSQDHDVWINVYRVTKLFGKELYYSNYTRAISGSFEVKLEKGYDYEYVIYTHSDFNFWNGLVQLSELIKDPNIFFIILFLSITFFAIGIFNPIIGITLQIILITITNLLGVSTLAGNGIIAVLIILGLAFYFVKYRI